jgi:sulfite reductase (NADPH) flavoprotein alpha-component
MAAEKQQFIGRHLVNRKLTGAGSEKITRHHEIAAESPVSYRPGDALGALPRNPGELVDAILTRLRFTGDEPVDTAPGVSMPIGEALSGVFNLSTPSRRLFEVLVKGGASALAPLMDKANGEALKHFLTGWNEAHDVLDLLEAHPDVRMAPQEFVDALRKMLPRLYSVASSAKAHPGEVHLLVVSVRYTIRGRVRHGACSTWLADRWPLGASAPMYLQDQQKHFAMPASPDTPMIMVGPGTGLAPFRAFLEERRATGARGPNWLFFGEQRRATDYFYEDQLTGYAADGFLRLDTAFSRDQAAKVYVQHRMREAAADLWQWLEDGAEVFVCGDKERMAADVDRELHAIVETVGRRSPDEAREYIDALKRVKRYKRDVY